MIVRSVAAAMLGLTMALPAHAANIVVVDDDGPNEGFNDPSPRAPVGENPGTTVGAQRKFAFEFAADLLASLVVSNVTIIVNASFDRLDCDPGSATLGQAGTQSIVDFENNPPPGARANTLYPIALANALSGFDRDPGVGDIVAQFNSSIDDNILCLAGTNWYYGVDNNPPGNDIDFLSTVAHELVHGLGFASFANVISGQFPDNTPDIYSILIRDLTQNATWGQMTSAQRAASANNDGNVVFEGASTVSNGAPTLTAGTNQGRVQLYAPTVVQPGSSISHWDTDLTPNALMEPFDTGDADFDDGIGLSTCALQDIGWTLTSGTNCSSGGNGTVGGGGSGGGTGAGGAGGAPPSGGNDGGGSGAWSLASLMVLWLCSTLLRRIQTRR